MKLLSSVFRVGHIGGIMGMVTTLLFSMSFYSCENDYDEPIVGPEDIKPKEESTNEVVNDVGGKLGITVVFDDSALRAMGKEPIIGLVDSDKPVRVSLKKFYSYKEIKHQRYKLFFDVFAEKHIYVNGLKYRFFDNSNPDVNIEKGYRSYEKMGFHDGLNTIKLEEKIVIPARFKDGMNWTLMVSADGGNFEDPSVDKSDFNYAPYGLDIPKQLDMRKMKDLINKEANRLSNNFGGRGINDFHDDAPKVRSFLDELKLCESLYSKWNFDNYFRIFLLEPTCGTIPKEVWDEAMNRSRLNSYESYLLAPINHPKMIFYRDCCFSENDFFILCSFTDLIIEKNLSPEILATVHRARAAAFMAMVVDICRDIRSLSLKMQDLTLWGMYKKHELTPWHSCFYSPFWCHFITDEIMLNDTYHLWPDTASQTWIDFNKELNGFKSPIINIYNNIMSMYGYKKIKGLNDKILYQEAIKYDSQIFRTWDSKWD